MQEPRPLIPPAEMEPALPPELSREECVAAWFDLVEATDEILLASLRSRGLSEAEVESAYRAIYARQVEEHDRTVRHMLMELDRRLSQHGR